MHNIKGILIHLLEQYAIQIPSNAFEWSSNSIVELLITPFTCSSASPYSILLFLPCPANPFAILIFGEDDGSFATATSSLLDPAFSQL
jgi:hypothetical protein